MKLVNCLYSNVTSIDNSLKEISIEVKQLSPILKLLSVNSSEQLTRNYKKLNRPNEYKVLFFQEDKNVFACVVDTYSIKEFNTKGLLHLVKINYLSLEKMLSVY